VTELVESAAQALPPNVHLVDISIPPLESEASALRRSAPATDCGEPLAEISGSGITVLHSYAQDGWRNTVDRQWLRTGTLARLRQVVLPQDFGIAVFDAWRPLALQRELFDATNAAAGFVAPPSHDPATPPPHLTGGTVDLTLSWRGTPLALGTTFDEFTDAAAATAFEDTPGPVRTLRRLLFHTLHRQGFVALAEEWWHFEYGTRLWSSLTGQPARYGPAVPARPVRGPGFPGSCC
jgi:zinc D-Ala-D-Ala dipeptidase